MNQNFIFSEDSVPFDWSEAEPLRAEFGPKAASLAVLPRRWTPPFALISAKLFDRESVAGRALQELGTEFMARLRQLAGANSKWIVRSSVLDETIWDRGTYESVIVGEAETDFDTGIVSAVTQVLRSLPGKKTGIVIQAFVQPSSRGEFGNLLRVSKTRDHWELSTTISGAISRVRFNAQRDQAANTGAALLLGRGGTPERLFGSVAAWLNNELLRGRSQRVNCEWIRDGNRIYIVQIDKEDEDVSGINPFQIRIEPAHQPTSAIGSYLLPAEGTAISEWDKLKVLTDLWDSADSRRPMLFYVPLAKLPPSDEPSALGHLESDFEQLIGPDNIVVRTSGRAGVENPVNLPRSEGMTPAEAAAWCLRSRDQFAAREEAWRDYAFVVHRFISARASAWARAEPGNPVVEIHGLWGLPDALQYCPYDIWEVHLPTQIATEYAEYKPHMLIAHPGGKWEYVRTRNDLARNLSIGRREAIDIATRTAAIADRLGKPCHVMWFVGCVDQDGQSFNIPWYWTEAHDSERNPDRARYQVLRVETVGDLAKANGYSGLRGRLALELAPAELELMRDMNFIGGVGTTAKELGVPVILSGSTLAHAYFALRRQGCAIITRGEKEFSRSRRSVTFGKLVRDNIPARIAQRKERGITRRVPDQLKKGFLTSKLLEEALEVRNAVGPEEKTVELADLLEVVRSLGEAQGITFTKMLAAADKKKKSAGGFDEGLVLLETAITGKEKFGRIDGDVILTQMLARKLSGSVYEIPFTFFGFMELDQPRSLRYDDPNVTLIITLRSDRIEVRVNKGAEQLELPLDDSVEQLEGDE
jgi:predicted house-cleaning noncanonical NTP pyrophosphatase (MazG superfamily)